MKFVALYREYLRGVKQFIDWPPAVGDLICTIQYVNTWICYYFYLISFVLSLFIWFFDDMRKKRERKGEKKSVFMFLSSHPSFLLAFGGRSRCCSLTPSTSTSLAEGSLFFSVALSLFRKLIWLVARKTRGAGLHPSAWETSEREEKKRRAFFNNACYTSSKLGVIGGGGGLAGGEMFGIRLIFSIGFYSSTSFFLPLLILFWNISIWCTSVIVASDAVGGAARWRHDCGFRVPRRTSVWEFLNLSSMGDEDEKRENW